MNKMVSIRNTQSAFYFTDNYIILIDNLSDTLCKVIDYRDVDSIEVKCMTIKSDGSSINYEFGQYINMDLVSYVLVKAKIHSKKPYIENQKNEFEYFSFLKPTQSSKYIISFITDKIYLFEIESSSAYCIFNDVICLDYSSVKYIDQSTIELTINSKPKTINLELWKIAIIKEILDKKI